MRIRLKENHHPSYVESRKLPIHILPMVVAKINKMIQQGTLEKATQGRSNWTSLIVVIRKPDEDLKWEDYKMGRINK